MTVRPIHCVPARLKPVSLADMDDSDYSGEWIEPGSPPPEEAKRPVQPIASGTCQLCGSQNNPQLWMLYLGDWSGWTCPKCINDVGESQLRRYMPPGERTEPAE